MGECDWLMNIHLHIERAILGCILLRYGFANSVLHLHMPFSSTGRHGQWKYMKIYGDLAHR